MDSKVINARDLRQTIAANPIAGENGRNSKSSWPRTRICAKVQRIIGSVDAHCLYNRARINNNTSKRYYLDERSRLTDQVKFDLTPDLSDSLCGQQRTPMVEASLIKRGDRPE